MAWADPRSLRSSPGDLTGWLQRSGCSFLDGDQSINQKPSINQSINNNQKQSEEKFCPVNGKKNVLILRMAYKDLTSYRTCPFSSDPPPFSPLRGKNKKKFFSPIFNVYILKKDSSAWAVGLDRLVDILGGIHISIYGWYMYNEINVLPVLPYIYSVAVKVEPL